MFELFTGALRCHQNKIIDWIDLTDTVLFKFSQRTYKRQMAADRHEDGIHGKHDLHVDLGA